VERHGVDNVPYNDMIFGISLLVELTKYFTLWPGGRDLDGGNGRRLARPEAGDVVEFESRHRRFATGCRETAGTVCKA